MLEKLIESVKILNEIDNNSDNLVNNLSDLDKRIDYWLHYIENENIPVTYSYNILKEIKRLRKERRKTKNEIELTKLFKENSLKLCNVQSREFLLNQMQKTSRRQKNSKYGYDAYTKDEFNKVLKIKEDEANE